MFVILGEASYGPPEMGSLQLVYNGGSKYCFTNMSSTLLDIVELSTRRWIYIPSVSRHYQCS